MSLANSLRSMFGNALLVKQEEGAEIDLQVGRTVTKAPKYMRTQLWLGVLQRHPGLGNAAAKQYYALLRIEVHPTTVDDIAKDVGRTFPNMPRFASEAGKARLQRVLMAYAAYDPEVNYCQGMNFVAAVLLIWLPKEADAFGGLVVLMQERGLRELYKSDLKALQARLWQISKILPKDLGDHLEQHTVLPVLYASSWLLTAFSADFPLFWSSRVLDVIFTDCYIEPMMKVVLGIITTCKPVLMKSGDMEAMVYYIKQNVPRWRHIRLQEVLTDSLSMEWTPAQQILLRQMEAEESVIQAVHRVNGKVSESPSAGQPCSQQNSVTGVRKLGSMKWASQMASPVALAPSRTVSNAKTQNDQVQKHSPVDLLSSDNLSSRSGGDATEHSDIGMGGSRELDQSNSSSVSAMTSGGPRDSAFTNEASHLQQRDSENLASLPTSIEVCFSKHDSTGSFGDFAGPSLDERAESQQSNLEILPEHTNRTALGPSGSLGMKDERATANAETTVLDSSEIQRENSSGPKADQNWWQIGSESPNQDLLKHSEPEIRPNSSGGHETNSDPFAGLSIFSMPPIEIRDPAASYHGGVQSNPVNLYERFDQNLAVGPSLRGTTKSSQLTPDQVENRLEEELLNFSANCNINEDQKLPMNSRKPRTLPHVGTEFL